MPRISPREAALLGDAMRRLEDGARNLAQFAEVDPGLAAECGIEVGAFEARTILGSGALGRIREAARRGELPFPQDLDQATRLDGVLALASHRVELKMSVIDQAAREEESPLTKLGSIIGAASGVIGLASGATGLVRSILGK